MEEGEGKIAEKGKEMMEDLKETLNKLVEDVGKPILDDLKNLAKKYGAWVVVGLVAVYLWKKLKK